MRFSDDGEPSGTAGMPILEVLRAKELVNCCVVVTRYFGGILLGAGGLVRAYSQSCAQAVMAAGVVTMRPCADFLLEVPYPLLGKIENALKSLPVKTLSRDFAGQVTLCLRVPEEHAPSLLACIRELSAGALEPLEIEKGFYPFEE